jgi:hypothetical protein
MDFLIYLNVIVDPLRACVRDMLPHFSYYVFQYGLNSVHMVFN